MVCRPAWRGTLPVRANRVTGRDRVVRRSVAAEPLNSLRKFAASTTLAEPLEWESSTLIKGDIAAITEVKQQDGGDLLVIGSSQLVQTLIGSDRFAEVRRMIGPPLAGLGRRPSSPESQKPR